MLNFETSMFYLLSRCTVLENNIPTLFDFLDIYFYFTFYFFVIVFCLNIIKHSYFSKKKVLNDPYLLYGQTYNYLRLFLIILVLSGYTIYVHIKNILWFYMTKKKDK